MMISVVFRLVYIRHIIINLYNREEGQIYLITSGSSFRNRRQHSNHVQRITPKHKNSLESRNGSYHKTNMLFFLLLFSQLLGYFGPAGFKGQCIMEFPFMYFVFAVYCNIVERMFSLSIYSVLGFIIGDLNEFSFVVIVSFNTKYPHYYLIRFKAVFLRQVIVAEKLSSMMTDSTSSKRPPAYSTKS